MFEDRAKEAAERVASRRAKVVSLLVVLAASACQPELDTTPRPSRFTGPSTYTPPYTPPAVGLEWFGVDDASETMFVQLAEREDAFLMGPGRWRRGRLFAIGADDLTPRALSGGTGESFVHFFDEHVLVQTRTMSGDEISIYSADARVLEARSDFAVNYEWLEISASGNYIAGLDQAGQLDLYAARTLEYLGGTRLPELGAGLIWASESDALYVVSTDTALDAMPSANTETHLRGWRLEDLEFGSFEVAAWENPVFHQTLEGVFPLSFVWSRGLSDSSSWLDGAIRAQTSGPQLSVSPNGHYLSMALFGVAVDSREPQLTPFALALFDLEGKTHTFIEDAKAPVAFADDGRRAYAYRCEQAEAGRVIEITLPSAVRNIALDWNGSSCFLGPVAFFPTPNTLLVVQHGDGSIAAYDTLSGTSRSITERYGARWFEFERELWGGNAAALEVVSTVDGTVEVWPKTSRATPVGALPSRGWFLLAGDQPRIHVWDLSAKQVIRTIELPWSVGQR